MSENEVLFVRSSKKNGSKSTEGDSSNNEDDIWDDTILIEAYDKAVQLAQQSYLKKKQSVQNLNNPKGKKKGSEQQKWKVGDRCKCQFSEDLKYYEADVIEILGSRGMCVVKYVGYENEEEVPLKLLKPSEGEEARVRQCQEALNENDNENQMGAESDMVSHSGKKSRQGAKKFSTQKKDGHSKLKIDFSDKDNSFNSLNFPPPHLGNAIIPPPPPPHMFNNLNEDEYETEAMSAMLISWYMSGYHTGYYQGLKMAKKQL